MRLVQTKKLKEGDIIARDIISYEGSLLLRQQTRFREVFRSKLLERNIYEVYIQDEISDGIEPNDIISPRIRTKITTDINMEFEKLKENVEVSVDTLKNVTNIIIDEISRGELYCELHDLKCNDKYTYEHCISVAILAALVCDKLKYNLYLKEQIVMGALIHDIGKMVLPKDILNKPGKLTEEEYEVIKTHTQLGYLMIKDNHEVSAVTKLIVLCHHEREDGSGYPLGKGKELHIGTKIVAACDLFHALISDRCYRQGLPINEVFMIAQSQQIDPHIRGIIQNTFAYYPVGCMVKLNTNEIGIVEKNFSEHLKQPLVRIVSNAQGIMERRNRIDLAKDPSIYIVERYE